MKKLIFVLSFLSIAAIAQVQVQVKELNKNHKISPLIYGINGNESSLFSAVRLGGNRFTGYNWETNYSNAGVDNNNSSDNYLVQRYDASKWLQPGFAVTQFADAAKRSRQYSTVTIPLAGYVVADANGPVKESEYAPSKRWNKIVLNKNKPFSSIPDLMDSTVYVDEAISFYLDVLGTSNHYGISSYVLDNEPDFWSLKHPFLHNNEVTVKELMTKSEAAAARIKELDPTAEVIGPALANMAGLRSLGSASDFVNQTGPLKYERFFDLYLDSMRRAEIRYGKRLLDVFDFHWYPEGIVSYKFDGNDPKDSLSCARRLQAPRALWDSSYYDPTYTLRLVTEFKKSINKFYPGTKIGFTEFLYGAEDHISGGLALADVLGVFGKEDVYLANKWYITDSKSTNSFGRLAYELYRNFDGKGGMFGETSVSSKSSDLETISTFSSVDELGRLHLILINKKWESTSVSVSTDKKYLSAAIWGFDGKNLAMTQRDSIKNINSNLFTVELPKYSASHLILNPQTYINITRAYTSSDSSSILISTGKTLQAGCSFDATKVTVLNTSSNTIMPVKSVRYSIDSSLIVVTVDRYSSNASLVVNVLDGFCLSPDILEPATINVINTLPTASTLLLSATVSLDGYWVDLDLSKQIDKGQVQNSFISIVNAENLVVYDSVIVVNNHLRLHFPVRFSSADTVKVKILPDKMHAIDGSVVLGVAGLVAVNLSTPFSPIVKGTVLTDDGFTIKLTFDLWLKSITNSSFSVLVDKKKIPATIVLDKNVVSVFLDTRINRGQKITVIYDTIGHVASYWGGQLNPFEVDVQNNVSEVSYVPIPSLIEAENCLYKSSGIVVSKTTDVLGGNNELYGIKEGMRFGVAVFSEQQQDYVCTMRYSTMLSGSFAVSIDGRVVDTIKFGGSASNWHVLSFHLSIPAGNHLVDLKLLGGFLAVNYVEFKNIGSARLFLSDYYKLTGIVVVEFDYALLQVPDKTAFTLTNENGKVLVVKKVERNDTDNEYYIYISGYETSNKVYLSLDEQKFNFEYGVELSDVNNKLIYTNRLDELNNWFEIYACDGVLYFKASDEAFFDKLDVKILTTLGQTVFNGCLINRKELIINQLPKGVYFVQIVIGEAVFNRKVLID